MKKLVVLTGAGISAESGFSTFRDSGGLWEKYPVEEIASHDGWLSDPNKVNTFYNHLRRQLVDASPNLAHQLLASLENRFEVRIITQNVDDLHERAGSSTVLHLHGELMKVCSSNQPDDPRYIETLVPPNLNVAPNALAKDGSLLRPFIVFFQEAVPLIGEAAQWVSQADIFIIIGTSLNVYPAAGLLSSCPPHVPIFLIDPKSVNIPSSRPITFIRKKATEGMVELSKILQS